LKDDKTYKEQVEELEAARLHRKAMARAGKQFGGIVDESGSEAARQNIINAIFAAMAAKHGVRPADD
jgi:hypothetical protein